MNIFKGIANACKKRTPEILIGSSLAGMLASVIFAIRNTPKMNAELEEKRNDEELHFTKSDEVKIVLKHQLPSIILFVTSSAGIIGANSIHLKRNAALQVLVQTGEIAATQYKTIVERVVSDDDKRKIDEQYEQVRKISPTPSTIIISGDRYWIRDEFTGKEFESNIQNIMNAANEINSRMYDERYISAQEWYNEIGIDTAPSDMSIGWNTSNVGLVRPIFDAEIVDGRPIVLMSYRNNPSEDFREW